MNDDSGPLGTEIRFFTGLLESNVEALNRVLTDDFLLIDVMGGSEIPKAVLLDAIRSGQLKFETNLAPGLSRPLLSDDRCGNR